MKKSIILLFVTWWVVCLGAVIGNAAPAEGELDADATDAIWLAGSSDITVAGDIDLSEVEHITLSPALRKQLKHEITKEVSNMHFHASLTWGQWLLIFIVAIIGAKVAHRVTLKTIFKPTKTVARKTEKIARETAGTIKKEWEES